MVDAALSSPATAHPVPSPDALPPGALPPEALPADARWLSDRYDLLDEVGRGGMSVVWLARERATGDEVAIKLVGGRRAADAEAVRRFAREARTAATLRHPHIMPTRAIEEHDGVTAIVSPFVHGGTLRAALQRHAREAPGTPFPVERALAVLRDVAAALAHAHAQRIVHRDVKPENIFLADGGDAGDDAPGRALLGDFGIARSLDSETLLTAEGASVGTPTYMAPEQVAGHAVDARSDVYALGLVGWELLAGRRPWQGETLYAVLHKQQHEELPDLALVRPDIPVFLHAALRGALAKDPAARWADGAAFLERLAPRPVTLPAPAEAHPDEGHVATVRYARQARPSGSAPGAQPAASAGPLPGPAREAPAHADDGVHADADDGVDATIAAQYAAHTAPDMPRRPAPPAPGRAAARRRPRRALAAALVAGSVALAALVPVAARWRPAAAPDTAATATAARPAPAAPRQDTATPRAGGPDTTGDATLAELQSLDSLLASAEVAIRDAATIAQAGAPAPPPARVQSTATGEVERPAPRGPAAAPPPRPAPAPTPDALRAVIPRRLAARCASPRGADQRACLLESAAEHDVGLTREYQALIGAMRAAAGGVREPAAVRTLRAEQRRWIEDRDRACRGRGGGRLWGATRVPCFVEQSDARAAELRRRRVRFTGVGAGE